MRNEKLLALLREVADASDVEALSVVDDAGRTIAGVGDRRSLRGLARIARQVAEDEPGAERDAITNGTDVMARAIELGSRRVYLAALGRRVRKMLSASERIADILVA